MADESPPSEDTPGWVKVSGIIVVVLIVLVVILVVTGTGDHGPGRHGIPSAGITASTMEQLA
jgi:hypothetical protein